MLAGLAIRVAFVLVRQSKVVLTTGDAYWYHYQAKLVADGRGFLNPFSFFKDGVVAPGADHPPGFILFRAGATKVGIGSAQGQRYLMCVVGTATVGVVALLGRRVVGPRVGLIAAAFAALYPNFWINDGMLMVETLYMLAIAASLYFAYGVLQRGGRGQVIAMSVALTVAALVRPETLILYPTLVVVLLLFRREQSWRERLIRLGLAALIPAVAFAPWAAYNQTRFDHPVPVSTGAGQTLAVGNCDLTYSGQYLGFYAIGCLREPQIVPPTANNQALTQRFAWPTDASGNPVPFSQLPQKPGIPKTMLDTSALKALSLIAPAGDYYLNSNGLISNAYLPRRLRQDEKRYTVKIDQNIGSALHRHPDRQDAGHSAQPNQQRRRVQLGQAGDDRRHAHFRPDALQRPAPQLHPRSLQQHRRPRV